MKYFSLALIALFTFFSIATVQAAGIKKWTDENGRVYYGDTPPRSANVETVQTNKRPTVLGKPLPRLSVSEDSDSNKNQPTSASPNSLDDEQAKVACDNAKKDLSVIKKSSRIQLRAADGSLRYMTKEEIDQRKQRSNEEIEKFCR